MLVDDPAWISCPSWFLWAEMTAGERTYKPAVSSKMTAISPAVTTVIQSGCP
jgi:hypothetical protein